MSSVEQELWNIFTYYTLHGNPLDPEHIRATQFVKLARDCQIIGSSTSEADPPLTEADINVTYTAEVTRASKGAPRAGGSEKRKMNYNDFLTALMKLSTKVYPRSRSIDDAFQRLLMDNILPLASRRCPPAVDMFLAAEDVQKLFDYYGDALEQMFAFYATSDKRTSAAMASASAAAGNSSALGRSFTGKSPVRVTKSVNSMKEALGYAEFLKFASDFDLSSSVILSTIELGDIYLSSIKAVDPDSSIRKLTFMEFWEALVRCALVAYSKISDTSVLDKIRGLFLYMWRAIHKSVPKTFNDRRNVSTYAGDLLAGAMLFNKRFTAQWAADGYRDYLSPDTRVLESGKTVLNRLLGGTSGSRGLGSTADAGSLSASYRSAGSPAYGGEAGFGAASRADGGAAAEAGSSASATSAYLRANAYGGAGGASGGSFAAPQSEGYGFVENQYGY